MDGVLRLGAQKILRLYVQKIVVAGGDEFQVSLFVRGEDLYTFPLRQKSVLFHRGIVTFFSAAVNWKMIKKDGIRKKFFHFRIAAAML